MNRKIMKRGGVAALAIAALGTAGLANALWTDQTSINGSLNSGSLSMGWDDAGNSTSDNDAAFGADGGSCSAAISGDLKTVNLTISNAYPEYQCVMNVNVHNYGTVPAKVTKVAFGAHDPAIQMLDSGSTVQTGSVVMPNQEGNYRLTVKVVGDLPEGTTGFSVPVTLGFANAVPADLPA